MGSAGPSSKQRRVSPWVLGILLVVASLILGIMTAGFGVGYMTSGLSKTYMAAGAPGVHQLDAGRGVYDLTRARTTRPDDAGPLTIRAEDPEAATVSEHGPGSYVEFGGVRHDLLASVEKHTSEPVNLVIEGDESHFPLVARRGQVQWMQHVGMITAAVAVLPIGLFVAGVVVMIREKHRQTRELVEFVSGVH